MNLGKLLVSCAAGSLAAFLAGELVHYWAHRIDYGAAAKNPSPTSGKNQLIIVLGCPANLDGNPSAMQLWRTRIAIRTRDPKAESTTVVFTGTDTRGGESEAKVMAKIGKSLGLDESILVLEEKSKSTWQNIEFTIPFIEQADVVQLVSTPLHARRARWYLARQRPDLTGKLVPAKDYRFGEHPVMKVSSAFYEIVGAYREWRRPRLPDVSINA